MKKILIILLLLTYAINAYSGDKTKSQNKLLCHDYDLSIEASSSSNLILGHYDPGYHGTLTNNYADFIITALPQSNVSWNCVISQVQGINLTYNFMAKPNRNGNNWMQFGTCSFGDIHFHNDTQYILRIKPTSIAVGTNLPHGDYNIIVTVTVSYVSF